MYDDDDDDPTVRLPGIPWGSPGIPWGPLGSPGIPWGPLGSPGIPWDPLGKVLVRSGEGTVKVLQGVLTVLLEASAQRQK